MKTSALISLQDKILRHRIAGEHLRINPEVVLSMIQEILDYRARGLDLQIAEELAKEEIVVREVESLSELGLRSYSDIAMWPDDLPIGPVGRVNKKT